MDIFCNFTLCSPINPINYNQISLLFSIVSDRGFSLTAKAKIFPHFGHGTRRELTDLMLNVCHVEIISHI